jgi:hypothetical protein
MVGGDSLGRQIVSVVCACLGIGLLAVSPAVSVVPWSRAKSSVEWAARLLRSK